MTVQVPDRLLLDGDLYGLVNVPFIPSQFLQLIRDEELHAEARGLLRSSACWRGYVATWRVAGQQLYLDGLEGAWLLSEQAPSRASWFTGVLILSIGEMLCFDEAHSRALFERELHLGVERGLVLEQICVMNQLC
jgi:hypothetical protein